VLNEQRAYWPITARKVFYRLLGPNAPLLHASKPNSQFQNNEKSYRAVLDVLCRGRLEEYLVGYEEEAPDPRVKTVSDQLHEAVVMMDPKKAHQRIVNKRLAKSSNGNRNKLSPIDPIGYGGRFKLSKAKMPLLADCASSLQGSLQTHSGKSRGRSKNTQEA
jgi:hypothetical protein